MNNNRSRISTVHAVVFVVAAIASIHALNQADEAAYLTNFPNYIAASYGVPLPVGLTSNPGCVFNNLVAHDPRSMPAVILDPNESDATTISAANAQTACDEHTICTVPAGTTLIMDSNLVVGALVIHGAIVWNETTQSDTELWLCAGNVVAHGGSISITLNSTHAAQKRAYIYISNNGAWDAITGYRTFGAAQNGTAIVAGRPMARTWSLLAATPRIGLSTIQLLHDPKAMDWLIGDRIQIAPTTTGSTGFAETYYVRSFSANNTIDLAADAAGTKVGTIQQLFKAEARAIDPMWTAQMQAEVINLR
jgi:hypothetical protein